jgi:hypothetical protein
MTTTAIIASQTAAATYNATVTTPTTFAAFGLGDNEVIDIKLRDSTGTYYPFVYVDGGGDERAAQLTKRLNQITVNAGDIQISKPITAVATEVVQYS